MRVALLSVVAAGLAGLSVAAVWPAFHEPVRWTPDALYYQARLLEMRGVQDDEALRRTFRGAISAELRARDPRHTGDPAWVAYNEPFYERRVALPAAGAVVYPLAGDRSLLYLSLGGYIAAILALFWFLLLRFRVAVAAAVALAAVFLPALREHASYPLTDSWGLALEIAAFAAAVLTLDRGLRWIPLWVAAVALLAFTRDSTWIPVLAVGWLALRERSRTTVTLFASGVAAALPALLVFEAPVKRLLALLVNGSDLPPEVSWSFIARNFPGAVVDLVRANGGFLRDGEWYTGLFLVGGVVLLILIVRRRRRPGPVLSLMAAGAVVSLLYVLAAPVFSAFRLELVFLPIAAYGLASAGSYLAKRADDLGEAAERLAQRAPARAPRG